MSLSRALSHPAWPWLALCAGLGTACVLAEASGRSWLLAWHAGLWTAHPWMLWSASLVHLGDWHLLGNLAALAVLAVLGAHLRADGRDTLAALLAWPAGNAALALWPSIEAYSGLSGLLCALLAVLVVRAASTPRQPLEALLLGTVLAFKLLIEQGWVHPIVYDPQWGFNVVLAAHLAGAITGLMFAGALRVVRRPPHRPA